MAKRYAKAVLAEQGADIYNGLIAESALLQSLGMPFVATDAYPDGTAHNSQEIGALLYNNITLQNAFIPELLNKIALTLVQSKYWDDPWAMLEKGKLEYGDIVQEVFIKMAKPHRFNQKEAEETLLKRDIPDVATAFHQMNYQYYYKRTISNEELLSAFSRWEGLTKFISDLIHSMFTSANYDAYQVKKYMIALAILNGGIHTHKVAPVTDRSTAEDAVAAARSISTLMGIMSPNYNFMGVPNYAMPEDTVIILNAWAEGRIDVSVLAADFNMDKAEFLTMHRLITSGFGDLDTARLGILFKNDPSYVEISQEDLDELNSIPFAIFDRNFFQIYDKINVITNFYNQDGLYWNYDYHVWKILGISPFANAMIFSTVDAGITDVTVSPSAVTLSIGQQASLVANVQTTGFAGQGVTWTSDNENVTVSQNGIVKALAGATGTVNITATSNVDATKSASAVVTIA